MRQKILITSLLALLLMTTTGCGKSSLVQAKKSGEYRMTIMKSGQNISTKKYEGREKELTLTELLAKSNTPFKSEMRGTSEVITELDGVISTASKSWNVYIDDAKITNNSINEIKINSKNDIKIIYEENK